METLAGEQNWSLLSWMVSGELGSGKFNLLSVCFFITSLVIILLSIFLNTAKNKHIVTLAGILLSAAMFILITLGEDPVRLVTVFFTGLITYSLIVIQVIKPYKQLYSVLASLLLFLLTYLTGIIIYLFDYIIISVIIILSGSLYFMKTTSNKQLHRDTPSLPVTLALFTATIATIIYAVVGSEIYLVLYWIAIAILIVLLLSRITHAKKPEITAGIAGTLGVAIFYYTGSTYDALIMVAIISSALSTYHILRTSPDIVGVRLKQASVLIVLGIGLLALSSIQINYAEHGILDGYIDGIKFSGKNTSLSLRVVGEAKSTLDLISNIRVKQNSNLHSLAIPIIQSYTVARVEEPGIVETTTIYDLESRTNVTFNGSETSIILLRMNAPITVNYGVEAIKGNYLLQASIEVQGILIPWTLLGNETISPVHSLILARFKDPLVIRTSSNYTILVEQAVIASKRFVGGTGSINETLLGIYMDGAIIGVKEGVIKFPDHRALEIPANVSKYYYQLWLNRSTIEADNPIVGRILSAAPSLAMSDLPGKGEVVGVVVPERVELNVTIPALGNETTTCIGSLADYEIIMGCTPLILPKGLIGVKIVNNMRPVIEHDKIRGNYLQVAIVRYALLQDGPYNALALAYAFNESGGDLLWLASNLQVLGNKVNVIADIVEEPAYFLGGLSPFMIASAIIIGAYRPTSMEGERRGE